jgi:ABC-type nitrate/sulfonate/bicarbonate transport system permease component
MCPEAALEIKPPDARLVVAIIGILLGIHIGQTRWTRRYSFIILKAVRNDSIG